MDLFLCIAYVCPSICYLLVANVLNPLIDTITEVLNNIDIIAFYKYRRNIITRKKKWFAPANQ